MMEIIFKTFNVIVSCSHLCYSGSIRISLLTTDFIRISLFINLSCALCTPWKKFSHIFHIESNRFLLCEEKQSERKT